MTNQALLLVFNVLIFFCTTLNNFRYYFLYPNPYFFFSSEILINCINSKFLCMSCNSHHVKAEMPKALKLNFFYTA